VLPSARRAEETQRSLVEVRTETREEGHGPEGDRE
jgi:hypothetical protein